MRLRITTPLAFVVDEDAGAVLAAEDASGCFGIQPGHADLLTSLIPGVASWRGRDGTRRYCAVRGGVLRVSDGLVTIATREAVPGDDLATLDRLVLGGFHADADAQRVGRVETVRLELAAMQQIVRHLRPGAGSGWPA